MWQTLQAQGESQPNPPGEDATWWCKLLARTAGIIGSIIALILGFLRAISLSPICIGAGIIQIFLALIVLIMEAPCCFNYVEAAKPIARFAENRPYLHKAIFYGVLSIIPIAMCISLSTIFGAGLILATGVIYGLMSLGKKADRDNMANTAMPSEIGPGARMDDGAGLVKNEPNPSGMEAGHYR